ncbi:MAG: hypothetical protein ACO1SV_04025 [Fimbriimonas sp.]
MEEQDYLDEVIALRADEPGMKEAMAEAERQQRIAEAQKSTALVLSEIQARHPHRTSVCGALLAEVMSKDPLADRSRAALHLGLQNCSRGLGALERIIPDLVKKVEASTDPWSGPSERDFLYNLLFAVAVMDSEQSHALLDRLLHESSSHLVRADVLENMAFEDVQFDADLVIPFASDSAQPPEILSALYALEHKDFANQRPEEARALAVPLLKHAYPGVRSFAVSMLKWRAANLDLLLPLADDPSGDVRSEVEDAARMSESLGD